MFTADTKMADLVHQNHQLLSIIGRFDISLGFGDDSVRQVCEKHGIAHDFFLEVVNAFHDPDYYPQENLRHFSVQQIVDYLRKTHRFYLDEKIPGITGMIEDMIQNCYAGLENMDQLRIFFNHYREELLQHINREEEVVFPYVLMVEAAYSRKKLNDDEYRQMKAYSMKHFQEEHDDIEEKLYDLKNIIIKYLPAPSDPGACNRILQELFFLEKDINDHSLIEDKVMAPKVKHMEQVLLKNRRSKHD